MTNWGLFVFFVCDADVLIILQDYWMERLISKKLQVDEHNDSLLEEPIMKKFIGVSRRISVDVQPIQNKFNFKLIQPEVEPSKITIRKRIIS